MNGEIFQIRSVIWSYVVAEAFLLGCINAAFFAVCFGICRPAVAATQFTAFMALMNFGVAGAQGLAGTVETHLGVSGAWLLGGVIQFSVALLMPFTLPKRGSQTENAIASG
jgi:PAT family beta-lactamase induction signal transducer AmpG